MKKKSKLDFQKTSLPDMEDPKVRKRFKRLTEDELIEQFREHLSLSQAEKDRRLKEILKEYNIE